MIARRPRAQQPLRLGFLISGTGRTLDNFASYLRNHPSVAQVAVVISDRRAAFGLARAQRLGIPTEIHRCRSAEDGGEIFQALEARQVNLVLLAGFLRLLRIPPAWDRRVLNIHPALIPKFCGQGYYGDRVHQAVLDAGETVSGCTVHFVDNIYDHGPILLQKKVPVLPTDTVERLADRVFEAECVAYPEAVRLLAEGRVRWEAGEPRVDPVGKDA